MIGQEQYDGTGEGFCRCCQPFQKKNEGICGAVTLFWATLCGCRGRPFYVQVEMGTAKFCFLPSALKMFGESFATPTSTSANVMRHRLKQPKPG